MEVSSRSVSVATLVLLSALLTPSPGFAQDVSESETIDFLSTADELALALSAAPEHLRAEATVHVLGPDGFSIPQVGTNGYNCVVNRDHPRNRKPICYDSEGTRTILPKVLFMGELMVLGVPLTAIRDSVQQGFESGRFTAPQRPGIAYMLSDGIRTYNPSNGQYGSFPPHIMFYAPNVSNDDIATDWTARQEHPWIPFVAYQGPHGMFVVMVGP